MNSSKDIGFFYLPVPAGAKERSEAVVIAWINAHIKNTDAFFAPYKASHL